MTRLYLKIFLQIHSYSAHPRYIQEEELLGLLWAKNDDDKRKLKIMEEGPMTMRKGTST